MSVSFFNKNLNTHMTRPFTFHACIFLTQIVIFEL